MRDGQGLPSPSISYSLTSGDPPSLFCTRNQFLSGSVFMVRTYLPDTVNYTCILKTYVIVRAISADICRSLWSRLAVTMAGPFQPMIYQAICRNSPPPFLPVAEVMLRKFCFDALRHLSPFIRDVPALRSGHSGACAIMTEHRFGCRPAACPARNGTTSAERTACGSTPPMAGGLKAAIAVDVGPQLNAEECAYLCADLVDYCR